MATMTMNGYANGHSNGHASHNKPGEKVDDGHIPLGNPSVATYDRSSVSTSGQGTLATLEPPADAVHITPSIAFDDDPDWVPDPSDPHCLKHAQFGHCDNEAYRYESRYQPLEDLSDALSANLKKGASHAAGTRKSAHHLQAGGSEPLEEPSYMIYFQTYFSYLILIVIGHMRDFVGKRTHKSSYKHLMAYNGYAALNSDFDSFYTRRLKTRLDDCFSRPVTGVPGRTITCLDRTSDDHFNSFSFTGTTTQALNISSYNYLGFAQSRGACADAAEACIKTYGIASGGPRLEAGTSDLHLDAERLVARFLGTESAMIVSMGFATNSTTLPAICSKGCLIISDELNHSSIRFGSRLSGAMVRQYKHNDMDDLEELLRECISQGQPKTHRPWRKILLIVEGLYSMEGTLVNLPAIVNLKRKYKFFLYVDEAHSIGALGPRGRGVCDYFDVDPGEIDILMGTFTKSFGAAGGYISGSKELVDSIRQICHSQLYTEAISPPVVMQIVTSMASIMGPEAIDVLPHLAKTLPPHLADGSEGRERLRRIAFNARYLSAALRKLGFIIYGHRDSPIVPLLIFSPGKLRWFSKLMLHRWGIVVVVVAYPATPLVSGRARFCVSAAHTKDDLDTVIRACDDVGTIIGLKLGGGKRWTVEQIINAPVQELLAD
ncbi:uncharacterized protein L969DRAFT_14202 [Mixia osmundae IAM 14324]|nr:uncharacterized protein L969DRAFT_14202 [Mixia osmundae IAM 14324]KEI41998.1 hypothetical protein L969DRAFT_14202 [Mixia osmundae IAM 14324]